MSSTVFPRYENTQSCTCGGARAKKFCQGLLTAPLWYYLLFTRAKKYATIASLTREAMPWKSLSLHLF